MSFYYISYTRHIYLYEVYLVPFFTFFTLRRRTHFCDLACISYLIFCYFMSQLAYFFSWYIVFMSCSSFFTAPIHIVFVIVRFFKQSSCCEISFCSTVFLTFSYIRLFVISLFWEVGSLILIIFRYLFYVGWKINHHEGVFQSPWD